MERRFIGQFRQISNHTSSQVGHILTWFVFQNHQKFAITKSIPTIGLIEVQVHFQASQFGAFPGLFGSGQLRDIPKEKFKIIGKLLKNEFIVKLTLLGKL